MKEMPSFSMNKEEMYKLLIPQMKELLNDESHIISKLSNASALLNMALSDINWVGFYLRKGDELILGPVQGKVACTNIKIGKGVCGTCAQKRQTQLVEDVHKFPGHIACDSASNSEIVVPIFCAGEVAAVLDIDSPVFSRFDEVDKKNLEEICRIIESACDFKTLYL